MTFWLRIWRKLNYISIILKFYIKQTVQLSISNRAIASCTSRACAHVNEYHMWNLFKLTPPQVSVIYIYLISITYNFNEIICVLSVRNMSAFKFFYIFLEIFGARGSQSDRLYVYASACTLSFVRQSEFIFIIYMSDAAAPHNITY